MDGPLRNIKMAELVDVVYFAEPDLTSLWAYLAEQHQAPFLPQTSQEGFEF